ncbi:MAG: hypothetical protein R3F37_00820 [Candidatus Competibacteraceae bacterium]
MCLATGEFVLIGRLMQSLEAMGMDALERRSEEGPAPTPGKRRYLQRPRRSARRNGPEVDPYPDADDRRRMGVIETGLEQRARLLNLLLAVCTGRAATVKGCCRRNSSMRTLWFPACLSSEQRMTSVG